jgi:hypothetical protein
MRTSVGRDAIFIINSVHAVDADQQYVTNTVAVVEMFLRKYYGDKSQRHQQRASKSDCSFPTCHLRILLMGTPLLWSAVSRFSACRAKAHGDGRVRGRGTINSGWLLQFGKATVNLRRRACGRTSGAPNDNRKRRSRSLACAPTSATFLQRASAARVREAPRWGPRMCRSSGRQHTERRRGIRRKASAAKYALRLRGRAAKRLPTEKRGYSAQNDRASCRWLAQTRRGNCRSLAPVRRSG